MRKGVKPKFGLAISNINRKTRENYARNTKICKILCKKIQYTYIMGIVKIGE